MIKFKQMTPSQKTDIVLRNILHSFIIFTIPLLLFVSAIYFELSMIVGLISILSILPTYYIFARVSHRKKWYRITERPFTQQYTFNAEQNLLGSIFFGQVFTVFLSICFATFLFLSTL